MGKRYYYIKLPENFYDREELKILESMENGYIYSNIYMKMILLSLKYEGKLAFKGKIPYDPKTLATILGHDIDNVKSAINILKKLDMIEILDDNTIFMLEIQELIGSITDEGIRKKEYRKRIEKEKKTKQIENKKSRGNKENKNGTMSGQSPNILELEKEIDIELDIELDKDNISSDVFPKQVEKEKNNGKTLYSSDVSKIFDGLEYNVSKVKAHNNKSEIKSKKKEIERKAREVVNHLNEKCGRHFRTIHRYITARLREGFTVGEMKMVIDYKASEWLGDEGMNKYLRPETLFSKNHFESYLNDALDYFADKEYKRWREKRLDEMDEAEEKGLPVPKLLQYQEWRVEVWPKIREKYVKN